MYDEESIDYFDEESPIPLADNDLLAAPSGFIALHGLYTHDFQEFEFLIPSADQSFTLIAPCSSAGFVSYVNFTS